MAHSPTHHKDAAKVAAQVVDGGELMASFPSHFLEALSDIIDARPYDIKFKLIPHGGDGYGKIECQEKECLAKKKGVVLNDSRDVPDGGKSVGIGSLELLEHHQRESPVHKKAVKSRLAMESSSSSNSDPAIKPEPSSQNTHSASSSSNVINQKSKFNVNQEKRKRNFIEILSDADDDEISFISSSSQHKSSHAEDQKKRLPLSKTTSNTSIDGTTAQAKAPLALSHGSQGKAEPKSIISPVNKRTRLTDPFFFNDEDDNAEQGGMEEDDENEDDLLRSDRSSAESEDLVDLRVKFNSNSNNSRKAPPAAPSSSATQAQAIRAPAPSSPERAKRDVFGSNTSPAAKAAMARAEKARSAASAARGGASNSDSQNAYAKFLAINGGDHDSNMEVEDEDEKKAATSYSTSTLPVVNNAFARLRDSAVFGDVPSSSSSPVDAAKDKGKGRMSDSGFMSDVVMDNSSSSSPARFTAADRERERQQEQEERKLEDERKLCAERIKNKRSEVYTFQQTLKRFLSTPSYTSAGRAITQDGVKGMVELIQEAEKEIETLEKEQRIISLKTQLQTMEKSAEVDIRNRQTGGAHPTGYPSSSALSTTKTDIEAFKKSIASHTLISLQTSFKDNDKRIKEIWAGVGHGDIGRERTKSNSREMHNLKDQNEAIKARIATLEADEVKDIKAKFDAKHGQGSTSSAPAPSATRKPSLLDYVNVKPPASAVNTHAAPASQTSAAQLKRCSYEQALERTIQKVEREAQELDAAGMNHRLTAGRRYTLWEQYEGKEVELKRLRDELKKHVATCSTRASAGVQRTSSSASAASATSVKAEPSAAVAAAPVAGSSTGTTPATASSSASVTAQSIRAKENELRLKQNALDELKRRKGRARSKLVINRIQTLEYQKNALVAEIARLRAKALGGSVSAAPSADQEKQRLVAAFERKNMILVQTEIGIKRSMQSISDVLKNATPAARPVWEATLATYNKQLTEAQNATKAHLRTNPALAAGSATSSAPATSFTASQALARAAAATVKPEPGVPRSRTTSSQSNASASSLNLANRQNSGFAKVEGGINAYGDDAQRMGMLLGGGPADFGWGANSVNPMAQPQASGSKNTANLGPTGYRGPQIEADSDSEDDNVPDWDRHAGRGLGIPEYDGLGAAPVLSEADVQNYFQNAAAGFDFNEAGEEALDVALTTLGLEKKGDKIPNSTIIPFAHQLLGIAWMLNQEKMFTKLRGGILADEMGLGKTVQTISLILLNQAKPDDDEKSTLVLAPLALLDQWKAEIEKYTDKRLSVWIYHGPGKNIKKKELKKYDIVLTTLQTLSGAWTPCDDKAKGQAKRAGGEDWDEADWYDSVRDQKTVLYMINWRRVVIDEAQNIRDRETKSSRAVCWLSAQYRWCLTGTPVTNTLTDIYSLLRFLKIAPWDNWDAYWRDNIHRVEKRRPDIASKRTQAVLKTVLLRRNKDAKLNGVRLINLPPKHMHDMAVFLSHDEQQIYSFIEGRSQQQLNKYLQAGTVMKNYAHIFVMLLRLRQCVGHPALVTESCLNSAYEKLQDPEADRAEVHQTVRTTCGEDKLQVMLKRRHDLAVERFEDETAGREIALESCPICFEVLDASAMLTICGHAFCGCIKAWMNLPETAAQNPDGFGEHERGCPNCRQKISPTTLFLMKHFEPTKEQIAAITGSEVIDESAEFEAGLAAYLKEKNMKRIKKDKKAAASGSKSPKPRAAKFRAAKKRIIKDSDDEDFIDDSEETNPIGGYTKKTGAESDSEAEVDDIEEAEDSEEDPSGDEDIKSFVRSSVKTEVAQLSTDVRDKFAGKAKGRKFIPSAKMEAMLRIIREAPKDDKIMIISQWTSMLALVSAYLTELNIPWISYQGDMNRKDREKAVKRFNEDRRAKCLLMSLKAGGVGLNLTGGNRAILLDLAWSPAVEAQCFDRLHRLGQVKEVYIERCIVAGTVEDRILSLQNHKQMLSDHSLGEGGGQKLKKMGIAELKMLFGLDGSRGALADAGAGGWQHPDANKPKTKKPATPPTAGPSGTTS